MRKSLILFITITLSVVFVNQSVSKEVFRHNIVPNVYKQNTTWVLYSSNSGVDIYYKYSPCILEMGYDQEWVLLKFVNTTSLKKIIEFDKIMEIDGVCVTCNDPNGEYKMSVLLEANQTIQGSCTVNDNAAHHIYSKMIEPGVNIPDTLTRFELRNLLISDL